MAEIIGALLITFILHQALCKIFRIWMSPHKSNVLSLLILSLFILSITNLTMGIKKGFLLYIPCLILWGIVEAVRFDRKTISAKQDEIKMFIARGKKNILKENYEEAIKLFNRVLEKYPNNEEGNYNKGYVLLLLENYRDAIKHFDIVLENSPNYVDAWFNKGVAFENLGQYEEALFCFDKILVINPKNKDVIDAKNLVLKQLNKDKEKK